MATPFYILCPDHECKMRMTLVGEKNGRLEFRCSCGAIKLLSIRFMRSFVTGNCRDDAPPPIPRNCQKCNESALEQSVQPGQISVSCGKCGAVYVLDGEANAWKLVE